MLPFDADWERSFCEATAVTLLDLSPYSNPSSRPTPSQQLLVPGALSTNASILASQAELDSYALRRTGHDLTFTSYSSLDPFQNEHELEDDYEDPEGIKEVFFAIPLGLDRTVESNSLPFVLHSYAQWFTMTVFDPQKIAHTAKAAVIDQFLKSSSSRSRMLLISELMGKLIKSRTLDREGERAFRLMVDDVSDSIASYQVQQWPASKGEREWANATLNNMLELISMQIIVVPYASLLRLLKSVVPIFLCACLPPHPPAMSAILLETTVNLRHFVASDVVTSITTGRPLLCLREDAKSLGMPVDPEVIRQIEEDVKKIRILPPQSRDVSMEVKRRVVQEGWREAVLIYMYMALGGADANDRKVKKAQREFMKLVNTIGTGLRPRLFLRSLKQVGLATINPVDRETIASRFLALPEFANPNSVGHDQLRILKDVWNQTNTSGRAAQWKDLREACWRITGV
ncbi:hypothetical protein RHS03_08078, partial [Rhizoctonia solani]